MTKELVNSYTISLQKTAVYFVKCATTAHLDRLQGGHLICLEEKAGKFGENQITWLCFSHFS